MDVPLSLCSVSLIGHSFLLQIQHHLQFLILNDLFKIQFHPELFQPGDRYSEVSEHGAYLWFALLSHARKTNLACTIAEVTSQ